MNEAPWTSIGQLQGEVRDVKRELNGKAEGYEIHSLSRRVDTLEHTCRELSSLVDVYTHRLEELEEEIRLIKEQNA